MSGIRSALGAIKDQTSISIAKVSSNSSAPEIDVLVVKATSHDAEPAEDRHIREILSLTSGSPVHTASCVAAISRRISRTRDWVVALKSISLVHRLITDGSPTFRQEILYATRRGTRLLNLSDFRDEAHSASWDHSTFVRTYSLFLDQRLEFLQYDAKTSARSNSRSNQQSPRDRWDDNYSDPNTTDPYYRSPIDERRNGSTSNGARPLTPVRDLKPERLIGRMHQLQQLLDRFLACRPTGAAKHNRLILISLYLIVKDSFQIYADICEVLAVLLDRFFEMEYQDCVKAFEAHVSAAKQIDELIALYAWCKDVGVARSSEYPEVQRITEKLLESLEEFVRDRAKQAKSPQIESKPEPLKIEEPQEPDMNSIKALPAPEPKPEPEPEPVKAEPEVKDPTPAPQPAPVKQPDLVDLREENTTADEQGNKLALALFSGPPASAKGEWEAFPSDKDEVTSAWQTPAAEPGKADWELALVETASNLSKQKASMGGGMDPLLLNGMYDQGIVRQHVSGQAGSVGSASSVALPGPAHAKTQMLALPAPDGSMQTVGGDPFAASLSVPPPAYVQMAEVEKKQQLLVQEQMMWQQYQQGGMQGQVSLNKLSNGYGYVPNPAMPYGMPMGYNPAGGYYPTY
ncbi:hypothetical protein LUZ61_016889 [Rhynchospora tenuis]|uniref:ENTH domain-containing protein n=1 Tax=Rhynchospora tenuis TaxID=198213 RepID=A0AAD5Z6E3_9POAL|nr:hypothetical protein LUZ61_016889 [Rhynchospora tenuis]